MNRVALITGGAQGIGLGIAMSLAEEGFNIAIADIQEKKDVAKTLDLIKAHGVDVFYCQADISNSKDRARMIIELKEKTSELNVLVNNAGVAPKTRTDILEATEESYEYVMRVNLQGTYFLTQAIANWMIEQQKTNTDFFACIINISSISSTVASPDRGEYCLSKAGVSMATKLWAVRLAEFNISVYEIRPGIIETNMTAGVKEKYDKLIGEGLLLQKRWGVPEDVGRAAAMIARGEISYSTGQVIMVDGGLSVERL